MKLLDLNPEISNEDNRVINGNRYVKLLINGVEECHYLHEDTILSLDPSYKKEEPKEEVVSETEKEVISEIKEEAPIKEEVASEPKHEEGLISYEERLKIKKESSKSEESTEEKPKDEVKTEKKKKKKDFSKQ